MTGSTISVSTVATSRPPLKAMASGLQNTDPMRGIMPKIAARAVSMIGRKRSVAELIIASRGFWPSALWISIWSNKIMELRIIIPDRAMIPSMAIKPNGILVIFNANTTQMRTSGAVSKAIIMRAIRFNWNMRIVMITKSIIGIGFNNL